MPGRPVTRRKFTTSLLAAAGSGGFTVRCQLLDAAGDPVPTAELDRFHLCDFLLRPLTIQPEFAPGEIRFQAPKQPFRISVPVLVPGFGHMYVYADNRGRGYTPKHFARGPLFLNFEFAADRVATVDELVATCRRSGIAITAPVDRRLSQARALLAKAEAAGADRRARARLSLESLSESLWAGEMAVLERARQAIARRGARSGFLFGANAFPYPALGKLYAGRFEALFNYATLPFYPGSVESVHGKPNWDNIDKILAWLDQTPIVTKGHPLIFFYPSVTPEWLKNKPYAEVKRLSLDYIRRAVGKFRSRIHAWEVINEAHHKNVLGLERDQLMDLTAAACRAAREADPTCFRIINNCCTWSEYLAHHPKVGERSVYDYLKEVTGRGIDFEAIGLQYYYMGRDLLEFERSIETFKDLGKPLHITELGLPSSSREIPSEWPHGVRFPWHGERWSETTQADWAEQFYTLAFSKPYIEAINWWDAADPAFIPHGGLMHADLTPKESYHRLAALFAKWRDMPS